MKNKLINFINLPTIEDDCYLSFAQSKHAGFSIERIYYIYQPVEGLARGKHAHLETQQIIFCLSGSFNLLLDNGISSETVLMNNPAQGVFLDRLVWHEMHNLTPDNILLVLASKEFDERDYIRDYDRFIKIVKAKE